MNLFKLIDQDQKITHLINNENLLKSAQRDGIKFNILTYCIRNAKWIDLNEIIDFISKSDSKEQLAHSLLNKEVLEKVSFYGNEQYAQTILKKIPLNIEQENYFLNIISMGVYSETIQSFPEAVKSIKMRKISSYKQVQSLQEEIFDFNRHYKHIIETNFEFYLDALKDYMKNYDLYDKCITLNNNNPQLNELENITKQLDKMLFNVNTKDELQKFLNTEMPNFINEQYTLSEDRDIFHVKTRQNIFLKNTTSLNKLNAYKKLFKVLQQYENVEPLLESHFTRYYLHGRKTVNTIELNQLLEEKKIKSINMDKNANVEKIVGIIKSGSSHVERIYGLEPEDVGGNELSLEFTFEDSNQNGKAALLPGGSLITYYLNALDDLGDRHFIHEYSHYLQDKEYFLSNVSYKESDNEKLDDDRYWNKVQESLDSIKSSVEDVIKYSLNIIENTIGLISEEQAIKITQFINNNVDKDNYSDNISNLIESFCGEKFEDWRGKYYRVNRNDIYEKKFVLMIKDLTLIHKSHHSSSFFKTLWKELDERLNLVYFQNKFEIHSRLNEGLTEITGKNDMLICYPTPKMMEKIKPHLEKFNNMLSNHYNDFVLNKTPSWRKEAYSGRNTSFIYEPSKKNFAPKISNKEETLSAISKFRTNIDKKSETIIKRDTK